MASVPFEFDCDKEAGFVMDPNAHKRFGYIVALKGFNAPAFAADLTVNVPYNGGATPLGYTALKLTPPNGGSAQVSSVVGVLEKFSWPGGVGDALHMEFYVSQENATQIKALQQTVLTSTKVNQLGWWIADYDQETKVWFEQAYPLSVTGLITGIVNGKDNPSLDVDLTPTVVKDGIDVNVYKITLEVVPAANIAYQLRFANSASKPVAKNWGLVVGTLAATAMKG